MHSPPDFFSEPASQQDSHQCHIDDNSAGEDNGGPGKRHWDFVIMAGQQFHTDGINADFCDEDGGFKKNRTSRMAYAEREDADSQCAENNQRQRNGGIPAITRMQPGNDAKVHGDAQTVQKQRDSKDGLGRKENRQAENPQDDTGADDIEGPVGKCDKKKVQKSADNCCCGQTDGHENGGFLADA